MSTQVTTPTARRVLRRSLFWIAVAVVAVAATLLTLGVFRAGGEAVPLSASSSTPSGAGALAAVLRQQGVSVTESDSLPETSALVADAGSTTILVYDPRLILDDEHFESLERLGANLVLIDPSFAALGVLAPAVANAGEVDGVLDADCDLPAVLAAGTVVGDGVGFRVIDENADATTCLSSGDGISSLVQVRAADRVTTVLGTTTALDNEHVGQLGNAALALTLLGENPSLIWYLPGVDDLPGGEIPTLADLTPAWVTPLVLLTFATVVAAAIWRGRRLGSLVIENLPVTVRASETMEGRARLYSSSAARLHALDSLRIGTVARLGRALGLPRIAGVDEIAVAAASILVIDPLSVRALLLDTVPAHDRDLVRLSDQLLRLESEVAAALRPDETQRRPNARSNDRPDERE